MDANEFRRRGKEMVDYVADYLDTIARRRVLPDVQPGYLREMLPNKAPKKGEPWDDVMKDVERAIMPGVTHWQHPRFHAYFPAGNSFPSILGGMLSDAIGCVGFSWAASPACTELETIVLDWLAKMIGLPPVFWHEHGIGGGVIQGSASDCVLVSLLAARYEALKELKAKSPDQEDGVLLTKLVAYCSKLAHSCVVKAGMICLVKIRELDIDENNSLRGQTLEKAIEEDRKLGLVPFYVAATLGTTAVCSFDNLAELGLVCERNDIWLHVDAAYAGSALICPEFRHLQRGVEHANSFNMNPNKWMLMNFDCSCLWVRDRRLLTTALTVDPVYLQHCNSDKAIDFRHWGIPLSRRFRSLKLWFVIRSYGIEGLQKYIREHCRLAKKFESLVRKDNRFIVIGKVTLGLVCFRLQGHNYRTQTLLRAINVSGKLHMVPALINEDYVIRFAVCAENATDDDITFAWDVISEISAGVIAACDAQEEQELAQQLEIMTSLSEEEEIIGGEEVKVLVGSPKLNGNGVAGGIPMSTSLRGFSINSDKAAATATGAGASSVAEDVEAGGEGGSGTEAGEEDEVFLYDNNIPSLPTLPSAYEQVKRNGPKPYHRRNVLVRMVSDPRCYSPRIVRSFRPHDDSRRSSDARPPSESSRPPGDGLSGYPSQAQQPQPQEGTCK